MKTKETSFLKGPLFDFEKKDKALEK